MSYVSDSAVIIVVAGRTKENLPMETGTGPFGCVTCCGAALETAPPTDMVVRSATGISAAVAKARFITSWLAPESIKILAGRPATVPTKRSNPCLSGGDDVGASTACTSGSGATQALLSA